MGKRLNQLILFLIRKRILNVSRKSGSGDSKSFILEEFQTVSGLTPIAAIGPSCTITQRYILWFIKIGKPKRKEIRESFFP